MVLRNFNLNTFIPLLYSERYWPAVSTALENIEHQDNTHLLVEKLSHPIDEIFDMSQPWKREMVEDVLRQAGD